MWFEEGDYRNLHLYYKSVSEGISKFVGIRIHLYQYVKISNFFCLSLEANLTDRESVFLLLSVAKVFAPVIDKRQEVNLSCTQLEHDLTLAIASGATVLKESQVWLEQVWIFLVRDDLVVVASDLNGLVVVAVLAIVPSDRVLAFVSECLTGGGGEKSEEFELQRLRPTVQIPPTSLRLRQSNIHLRMPELCRMVR
jgi:hypothetical protein